eukprot:665862-Pelagomonas_calceolata.AAC.2
MAKSPVPAGQTPDGRASHEVCASCCSWRCWGGGTAGCACVRSSSSDANGRSCAAGQWRLEGQWGWRRGCQGGGSSGRGRGHHIERGGRWLWCFFGRVKLRERQQALLPSSPWPASHPLVPVLLVVQSVGGTTCDAAAVCHLIGMTAGRGRGLRSGAAAATTAAALPLALLLVLQRMVLALLLHKRAGAALEHAP